MIKVSELCWELKVIKANLAGYTKIFINMKTTYVWKKTPKIWHYIFQLYSLQYIYFDVNTANPEILIRLSGVWVYRAINQNYILLT